MKTWIVVPNRDGLRWLPGLIASIAAQTRAPDEVLVVDDGSVDGSVDWLSGEGISVLTLGEPGGFARAANAGLSAALDAGADAVALVNTDVELDPAWLQLTVSELETDDRAASVASKMVSLADAAILDDTGDTLRRDGACEQRGRGKPDTGAFDEPGDVWGACAGAAVYRAEALREVGLFDERLVMYLEDVDLALRLRLAGWTCRYVPAIARHAGGGSGAVIPHWVARNTLLIVVRWFPLRWFGPVAYRQLSWLAAAARSRRLRAHLRGLAAAVPLLPAVLRERRRAGGSAYPAIAAAVPDRPWRGPAAGGHPEAPH